MVKSSNKKINSIPLDAEHTKDSCDTLVTLAPFSWPQKKDGDNEVSNEKHNFILLYSFLKQSLCHAPNTQHHVIHHADFFWNNWLKKIMGLSLTTI